MEGMLSVCVKVCSRLFFLSSPQIQKVILMSLTKLPFTDKFNVDEAQLEHFAHNITNPPYKRVFTSLNTSTVLIVLEGGAIEKIYLSVDMPQISMTLKTEEESKAEPIHYKKYIEPTEFNILV